MLLQCKATARRLHQPSGIPGLQQRKKQTKQSLFFVRQPANKIPPTAPSHTILYSPPPVSHPNRNRTAKRHEKVTWLQLRSGLQRVRSKFAMIDYACTVTHDTDTYSSKKSLSPPFSVWLSSLHTTAVHRNHRNKQVA